MAETETAAAPETAPETAPVRAPAPPGATNGAGVAPAASADWRASLPEELKAEPSLGGFKDVGALAKAWVETKRMVGDAVKIPGPDATPEQRAAYNKRIGVPDSPEDYAKTIKLPEMPKDHPEWSPTRLASARIAAHENGLTPAQLQGMINAFAKDSLRERDLATMGQTRAAQAEQAEALKVMEREWGPRDGPTWKRNVGLAERVVRHFFGGDQRMLDQLKMGASDPINPGAVLGLARIGEGTMEDIFHEGETPGAELDKDDLTRRILETRAQMEKMNAGSRQYGELRESLERLYKLRYTGTTR